jgi:hypothetical protein
MKKILGIAILVTVMACNQAEKKAEKKSDTLVNESATVSSLKLKDEKLSEIFNAYIVLKNALVKSDLELAKKSAGALHQTLVGFKGCESTAHLAKTIADDTSLANQRKDFTAVSTDLITLFKTAELSDGTIYVQHCPMANKGDGGDWLSAEKEIRNPYYGDEMLECGRVVEEITKK